MAVLAQLRPAATAAAFTRARFARSASTAIVRAGARATPPTVASVVRPAPHFRSLRAPGAQPDRRNHHRSARFVRCRAMATSVASEVHPGANHADLPKNFEQGDVEERLYKMWEENGYFKPSDTAAGEPFTIAMPPPNVTGALHMGHAMFVTLQDIMARNARMRGRPTLWVPGTDHAGIATQLVVERSLEADGLTREGVGREEFERRTWEWKKEYGGRIGNQIRRLGASCDWSRERFTLDEGLSEAVLEAFVSLHDRGLIYKGTYMVNWAPKLQTAVSDLEVEYADEPGTLYYFKYPVEGGEGDGRTCPSPPPARRPSWGDTAVAVNPADDRFKSFIGKRCVVPFSNGRTIPIIGDDYVDIEFGTGALKITPGHDPNDYEIGQRVGLPTINIMNKDGSMNGNAGAYEGLDRAECRTKLWADMESQGIAIKSEPYQTRVPRSQRGGEVIEPLVSEQWFVKMETMAKPALEAVETGELTIVPSRFEKIYKGWLTDIRDWCISRQLWWGHRIPVWYVHESQAALDAARSGTGKGSSPTYVVARNEAEATAKAKAAHGEHVVLYQEEDVLDTWFSSGLWPFSTLGWPNEEAADLAKFFPTQVMETGHDILFFWVARMVMMSYGMTGKLPFHTVFLHGLVRDEKGRKMSKSLGNVVDPLNVIDEQGCDALRFTLATGTAAGQDLNLNMDRLASNRNFTNKIWNSGKFVLYSLEGMSDDERIELVDAAAAVPSSLATLPLAERWIVSRLHAVVDHVTSAHDRYDFGEAVGRRTRSSTTISRIGSSRGQVQAVRRRPSRREDHQSRVALRLGQHPAGVAPVRALRHRGGVEVAAAPRRFHHEPELAAAGRREGRRRGRRVRDGAGHRAIHSQRARGVRGGAREEDPRVRGRLRRYSHGRGGGGVGDGRRSRQARRGRVAVCAAAPADAVETPGDFVQTVVSDGVEVYLPLSGIVDPAKELARLGKQAGKLEKEVAGLAGRLKSPKFVEKAPAEVVEKSKKELAELEEQLASVRSRMSQMEALAAK